ncbi:hypothetical protein Mycch_0796 [Mycolicibacterium chubuense NBB4]|uniref:Uncharacterized protein n=2 Tax=Mycolicibacterium chubuense TaxID=1800 RepID=I4BEA5_MYCCN|nr:hypothetical protein Mycch_0796 [Mycolicibacterium chubuense NBB4]
MARRRSEGGGGIVGVLGVLLVIGFIIKYIWWIVGAAALAGVSVGIYYLCRAAAREAEERRKLAEKHEAELKLRADRQHRWTLLGDSRGVYGSEGAAAMRAVTPPPSLPDGDHDKDVPIARIAATAAELEALATDKPPAWQQALFASVLVQRTTPLSQRLRDSELGFTPTATRRVITGEELASILIGLIDEMLSTTSQLARFVNAPAFMAAFSSGADGSDADPEAIKHIAHRMMDYRERFLELSERCRGLSAPSAYTDVIADCARLLNNPLQSYREFVTEYVDVINALPGVLEHATGTVHLGAIGLCIDLDDVLFDTTYSRLKAMGRL